MMRVIVSFFLIVISGITLMGCDAQNDSTEIAADTEMLTGSWRVEDVDQGGVIDNSMVTMLFEEENRIAGSTGCNQYTASLTSENKTFQVATVASTRRACVAAMAKQEQRFLAAINDAVRYEIESNTWLLIFDASNKQRLKAIQMETAPKYNQHDVVLDDSSTNVAYFNCNVAGEVGIRFLDPETIELSISERLVVLERSRSASGAHYVGEAITFWNKGTEALLTRDDKQYACRKRP